MNTSFVPIRTGAGAIAQHIRTAILSITAPRAQDSFFESKTIRVSEDLEVQVAVEGSSFRAHVELLTTDSIVRLTLPPREPHKNTWLRIISCKEQVQAIVVVALDMLAGRPITPVQWMFDSGNDEVEAFPLDNGKVRVLVCGKMFSVPPIMYTVGLTGPNTELFCCSVRMYMGDEGHFPDGMELFHSVRAIIPPRPDATQSFEQLAAVVRQANAWSVENFLTL